MKRAFARLRAKDAQPIRAVKFASGMVSAGSADVDDQARNVWGTAYRVSGRSHAEAVGAYMGASIAHVFNHAIIFAMALIPGAGLMRACKDAKATAAGPDCWAPEDWRLLSDTALWNA